MRTAGEDEIETLRWLKVGVRNEEENWLRDIMGRHASDK